MQFDTRFLELPQKWSTTTVSCDPYKHLPETSSLRGVLRSTKTVSGTCTYSLGETSIHRRKWRDLYSPELSTDFLELPQSLEEMREYLDRQIYAGLGVPIDLITVVSRDEEAKKIYWSRRPIGAPHI